MKPSLFATAAATLLMALAVPAHANDPTEAEINVIIDAALAEAGVSGPQAMGKVMPIIKAKVAGKADMGVVSQLLKAKLAG